MATPDNFSSSLTATKSSAGACPLTASTATRGNLYGLAVEAITVGVYHLCALRIFDKQLTQLPYVGPQCNQMLHRHV